jgi:hypothetical protein
MFDELPMIVALLKRALPAILIVALPIVANAAEVQYNRDVRPVLSENCFPCHGPDSAARKADLRLDHFENAAAPRKGSKAAIVPRKPNDSELVARIQTTDPDEIMPPEKAHKTLKPAEKDLLVKWISEGAKYEPHWSFITPKRPSLPSVRNKRWVRGPIDHFILARLEREGLKPAPEADKRTLIRRVSLDLTGLPPSIEDVEKFVADKSPDAYEKLVDRLLASSAWGEHRGRYWLDAARYADTHGIHIDNFREMWAYRDSLIDAFNKNMPFDQFTIEQLAGDILPNANLNQKIASGFHRCNITTSEGGAIDDEYYVLYARDRTETTSQVWLGLTAGCAVCHDHKFDPLPQKEFYQLSAFFNNTTQKAMDGNVKDTPPIIVVPKFEDRARWAALPADKVVAKKNIEQRKEIARKDFEAWVGSASPEAISSRSPKEKLLVHAPLSLVDDETNSFSIIVSNQARKISFTNAIAWQDGAVGAKAFTVKSNTIPEIKDIGNFERDEPFSYAAWVRLGDVKDGAIFSRMDEDDEFRGWDLWMQGGKPGTHIVHKWPKFAIKVVSKKAIEPNRWTHVCVTYDGSFKAGGVKVYIDGDMQDLDIESNTLNDKLLNGSIKTKVPFKIGQRKKTSRVEGAGIEDLRLYGRVLEHQEVKELGNAVRLAWLVSKPADKRTKTEADELYTRWLTSVDKGYQAATAKVNELEKEEMDIRNRGTISHVMEEKSTPAEAYILFRGEYEKRRDKVSPETPTALPPMSKELPRNRLGLAKWLLQPEHPLTARVTVNRFWQEVFGTGIVKSSGDFGVTGEMPSHPELLDWLAVDFRENGWDVKRFYKMIVMSATYRQSAETTPAKIAKDPANRLLAHGPRFRMDAEMIRDYALASSGLLVGKIGGPSVKPYQPPGVWEAVAMIGSNTRDYKQDSGESLYRRSMYTFWKRAAPPASMDIFNAPSREVCTVRRERTDTPLQALVTLNDPQFIEAARSLAQLTLQKCDGKENERIEFLAKRILARPLRSEERRIVENTLKDLLAEYRNAPKEAEALIAIGESKADAKLDKPTLAAYTMVANELFNMDEVLNK